MKLDLYRRHSADCKYADKGQHYTGCSCPIWVYGIVKGQKFRKSVGLRDWSRAVKRVERWEERPTEMPSSASLSIQNCIDVYLDDCRARRLAESTIVSYVKTLAHFVRFCETHGITEIVGVDVAAISNFRSWRKTAANTQRKELETLRSFGKFAVQRDWFSKNYAVEVKPPKNDRTPTLPFEPREVQAILRACDRIENPNRESAARARIRNRALVLLMLYSGMRISDVVKLERSRVDFESGRLMIRMMKTRTPLYVRIPDDAINALRALPMESKKYFFWSGNGKLSSAVGSARRSIECLMQLATIEGHPHRFRDTFAVELLKNGDDIRTVQLLLGHTSVQTTERHYSPFVAAFQGRLDDATSRLNFGQPGTNTPAPERKSGSGA